MTIIGATNNVVLYVDDNGYEMRTSLAHIINWYKGKNNTIYLSTIKGDNRFTLDSQAAVDEAIALIDGSI